MTLVEKQAAMKARIKLRRSGKAYYPTTPTRVYLIEHPAGVWYVGLTQGTVKGRWTEHRTDARRGKGSLLHQTIRELGETDFTVTQLAEFPNRKLASESEKEFIRDLRRVRSGCLNKTLGGAARRMKAPARPAWLRPRRVPALRPL